jgi:tRNA(Ile)-lysidine synthase
MKISINPGVYVVAVSGGVDSVVLLDLLAEQPDIELMVAHFDHGIREDSGEDCQFVQKLANSYGLPFEYAEGKLGANSSEETARTARYEFLEEVRKKHSADAIITAHHQDDLIETAILNLLRGTGRKGLTSLSSRKVIIRPLLHSTKTEMIEYAKSNNLEWREDSTNQNMDYLRNYVRKNVVPKLSDKQRGELVLTITELKKTNEKIDNEIARYLQITEGNSSGIDKNLINSLSHAIACETLAEWLRLNNIRDFDRKTIERLVVAVKTYKPGQRADINKQNYLQIDKNTLVIKS